MKKTALLAHVSIAVSIALASPSMAKSYHHRHGDHWALSHHRVYAERDHHHRDYAERDHRHVSAERVHHRIDADKSAPSHAGITCEMVRAYVAQVGVVQARAMALSAGMTASEERRAKHCLESGA
jgi:hypothetical protein